MNYDALKQKLTDLQRALAQCRNNLDNYEKQGKSLEQEEMQIQQSFERTLSEESNKELQEYVNNLSEPIANKVGELEEELLELEERYEEEMSKLSGLNVTKKSKFIIELKRKICRRKLYIQMNLETK